MKTLGRVAVIAALVIGLAILAVFVTAQLRPLPGEIRLDSGHPRNASAWVLARDGTKLAVDVWLPLDLRPGETVHAVIEGTRYWRDFGITRLGRVAAMLGLRLPGLQPSLFADFFTRQGYAYVIVDVRGTGASYGRHDIEYSGAEIADYREVLDWVTQQNWSSGSAVSFGVSYG